MTEGDDYSDPTLAAPPRRAMIDETVMGELLRRKLNETKPQSVRSVEDAAFNERFGVYQIRGRKRNGNMIDATVDAEEAEEAYIEADDSFGAEWFKDFCSRWWRSVAEELNL